MKNYTYVQARMHAGHPSAGSRLHLTENAEKYKQNAYYEKLCCTNTYYGFVEYMYDLHLSVLKMSK